jgi:hypothetical protein
MSQISPPFRILLVCAVAFMASWMLFLRPKAETVPPVDPAPTSAAQPTAAGGTTASSTAGAVVERANEAKATAEAAAAKRAGEPAAATTSATRTAETAKAAKTAAKPAKATAGALPAPVRSALAQDKVLVLLFWSPRAADDRAVHAELADVNRRGGDVVVEAAPLKRLGRFQRITRGANVAQSPTVVVVDRERKVETLVGYVDHVSIDQLVTDALRNS